MYTRLVLLFTLCVALLGSRPAGSALIGKFHQIHPLNHTQGAIAFVEGKNGGQTWQDGAVNKGASFDSAVFCELLDDVEKGLKELKEQLKRFSDDLQRIPEREEFKKLRKELDRLAEELKRAEKAAREKLQKEIVPRLKKEMEKLKQRLRKLLKEEESKPVEV
jgi:Skp family chaperone for outer membrane proteins